MATIKDIAEHAEVSIATVSRVLNNDESMSVSEATRAKIFKTADQLGYTRYKKNLIAKNENKKVAIIQWYTESEEINDLYYYSIRIGIERRAIELGYEIIRLFNDSPLDDARSADGVIAIGKYSNSQIKDLEKISDNLIFVDSDTLSSGHTCVTTDFTNSVISALDHFINKGQTKIGILTGEEMTADHEFPLIDPRFYTFKNYLTQQKLYNPDYVFIGKFSTDDGYQLMKNAIETCGDNLPEAFFIASDALAIGALRALQEKDIKVPDRVSIISFNDTVVAKQVYPPLSSVTVFTEEMGILAMNTLNQQLESFTPEIPVMMKLATVLTLRSSSK
ncbi:LacI family transcriptional regulator [Streptococcus henryi]|uniref:LacI family transcriptional regulator n=1 Tax=Streptococcus henryi TaxID=439219 RepID=A0A1G6B0Z0_9STRE|nr:LacI family DNA-binding transcriptional regulator [Streptococcus henryi]SDB14205.1 LacI family transcriptional regulator [Streptococcus henryi]